MAESVSTVCDLTQSYAPTGGGIRTYLHAKCDYMSRQTLVPARWSMQENRYVPSSP